MHMHANGRRFFIPPADGPVLFGNDPRDPGDPRQAARSIRQKRRRDLIERWVVDLVIAQADRIEELERENAKLQSQVDFDLKHFEYLRKNKGVS